MSVKVDKNKIVYNDYIARNRSYIERKISKGKTEEEATKDLMIKVAKAEANARNFAIACLIGMLLAEIIGLLKINIMLMMSGAILLVCSAMLFNLYLSYRNVLLGYGTVDKHSLRVAPKTSLKKIVILLVVLFVIIFACMFGYAKVSEKLFLDNPASKSVGDTVYLGHKLLKPVSWIVVDKREDCVMLVAKSVAGKKVYNNATSGTIRNVWYVSSVRKWLNNSYYNSTFSANEKKYICNVKLKNVYALKYSMSGGEDTVDKVFILSLPEYTELYKEYATKAKLMKHDNIWIRNPAGTNGDAAMTIGIFGSEDGDSVTNTHSVVPAICVSLSGEVADDDIVELGYIGSKSFLNPTKTQHTYTNDGFDENGHYDYQHDNTKNTDPIYDQYGYDEFGNFNENEVNVDKISEDAMNGKSADEMYDEMYDE